MLQVTKAARHNSSDDGFIRTIELWEAVAPQAAWSFIFIVSTSIAGEKLVHARTGFLVPPEERNGKVVKGKRFSTYNLRDGDGIEVGYAIVSSESSHWRAGSSVIPSASHL